MSDDDLKPPLPPEESRDDGDSSEARRERNRAKMAEARERARMTIAESRERRQRALEAWAVENDVAGRIAASPLGPEMTPEEAIAMLQGFGETRH